MKHPHSTVLSVVLGLAAVGTAHGAVVLSNLGQTQADYDAVSGPMSAEVSHAVQFTTGSSAGGYTLDSVRISIRFVSGSAGNNSVNNGGFSLSIYNHDGTYPDTVRGTLTGNANPATTGLYTYTASGISLAPSTSYWVVARVTSGDSTYLWNFADSASLDNPSTGWTLSSSYAETFNLSTPTPTWDILSGTPSMLEINATATPVPEPAEYAAVSALGLAGAAWLRRRRVSRGSAVR